MKKEVSQASGSSVGQAFSSALIAPSLSGKVVSWSWEGRRKPGKSGLKEPTEKLGARLAEENGPSAPLSPKP